MSSVRVLPLALILLSGLNALLGVPALLGYAGGTVRTAFPALDSLPSHLQRALLGTLGALASLLAAVRLAAAVSLLLPRWAAARPPLLALAALSFAIEMARDAALASLLQPDDWHHVASLLFSTSFIGWLLTAIKTYGANK